MRVESEHIVSDDGLDFVLNEYIARDGKRLSSEATCLRYEKKLDVLDKLRVLPCKETSIREFDTWYYISSATDFYILRDYIAIVVQDGTRTDFECFDLKDRLINDWVSYSIETQGGGEADICNFVSFEALKEDIVQNYKDLNNSERILKSGK